MEKWKCQICNKEINYKGACSETYIICHIKRKHKISYLKYLNEYYKNIEENAEIEKCNFCKIRDAIPNLNINHKDKTFFYSYERGYFCQTQDCKNEISLSILGKSYDKSFEYIGSRVDYLCILHKKKEEEIKYNKSLGTKKEYFIKKYGEIEGLCKWNEMIDSFNKRMKNTYFGKPRISKAQNKIKELLINLNIDFEFEKPYKNEKDWYGYIDFYIPNKNMAIEFYGSFWHCDPKFYNENFFNKRSKLFAYQIWNQDKNRINYIYKNVFKEPPTILIIWERRIINEKILLNLINENENLKTIVYYD